MNLIEFFKPQKTLSISTTGEACFLNCAHCGGHFLKSMTAIEQAADKAKARDVKSCLISGGCDKTGRIPMNPRIIEEVKRLKNNYTINMHVGMLKASEVDEVCSLADVISLDIPASTKVVREVYGLEYEYNDYIKLYSKLREKIKVVPHVCLGLIDSYKLEDEVKLVERLAVIRPESLCYIIFTPVPGTGFENKKPPNSIAVENIFKKTVELLPEMRLYLGCMRPGGGYREEIDVKAVEAGVQGIVMPARKAVERAEEMGLNVIWKDECCAF
ncbi:MAG: radical SAM protein [Deltaproteobacteria bacterium]